MATILLVIHLMIALALVGLILMQRTEGGMGGLGGGSSGGGSTFGGLMSSRGSANFLTRTTALLAASFMATSILLAVLAGTGSAPRSILEEQQLPPMTAPTPPGTDQPATPAPPVAD